MADLKQSSPEVAKPQAPSTQRSLSLPTAPADLALSQNQTVAAFQKTTRIAVALSKLAVRRQAAKLSPEDFEVYDEDLSPFEIEDIELGCLRLGQTERPDFEPAFPPAPTLVFAVKRARNERLRLAREQREREQEAAEAQRMIDHPEDFERVSIAELVAELAAKRALDPSAPQRQDDVTATQE